MDTILYNDRYKYSSILNSGFKYVQETSFQTPSEQNFSKRFTQGEWVALKFQFGERIAQSGKMVQINLGKIDTQQDKEEVAPV